MNGEDLQWMENLHVSHNINQFIGREFEMHQILKLILTSNEKLITVMGEPGIGKSAIVKEI